MGMRIDDVSRLAQTALGFLIGSVIGGAVGWGVGGYVTYHRVLSRDPLADVGFSWTSVWPYVLGFGLLGGVVGVFRLRGLVGGIVSHMRDRGS